MSSPFKMEFKKKSNAAGKRKREDGPKKHRSSEFCPGSSRGIVRKLTSSDVRSLVTDVDVQVIICPLGEQVEVFSSQQMVYLESAVEEDAMGRLERRLIELEGKLSESCETFQREMKSLRDQLEVAVDRLAVCELFLHQGMSIALQAFCDFVLVAFFRACGMEAAGLEERAAWLANRAGGEAYVTTEPVTLKLFGAEKSIGRKEFSLIKSLCRASSELSFNVCHSATPLEVAVALEREGTSVFASEFTNICALFQVLFNVTPRKMVKDWKEGNLNKEFNKQFKSADPPQIRWSTST